MDGPDDILDFWFADAAQAPAKAEARMPFWFTASAGIGVQVRERFKAAVESASRGERDAWKQAPRSALALVLLLDQFPRNIWRGTAEAFAFDPPALAIARESVSAGFLSRLAPIEQMFLTLPYQHCETLDAQRESLRLCRAIVAAAPPDWQPMLKGFAPYAAQHLNLIERFGRFPHRNKVLGRVPTDAERAYLKAGGATFGQD